MVFMTCDVLVGKVMVAHLTSRVDIREERTGMDSGVFQKEIASERASSASC